MKKQLLFIIGLMLALVSTNANAYETLSKNVEKFVEVNLAKMQESDVLFALKEKESGMFIHSAENHWDMKVCDEATFRTLNNQGGYFKLEQLEGTDQWLVPVYEKSGARRTYWAGNAYLNTQPDGQNVIFGLAGTNSQHGQDGENLAVWELGESMMGGVYLHCVGRDIYLGHDGTDARPVTTVCSWIPMQLIVTYSESEVEATYTEIKDVPMLASIKADMDAAKAAYDADKNDKTLNVFGDAVNAAVVSANAFDNIAPGKDMTAVIANVDAENGQAEPWVGLARVINNAVNAHTGSWLFETAGWGPKHGEMTQTVEGLPAGKYELSVYFMGATETYAKLHANDAVSEEVLGSGDSGDDRWKKISVICTVEEDGKLVILAEGNTTEERNWCNFDDFSLTYLHGFNTIAAGEYTINADVALAEGVTESMVPDAFKKYLGSYKTYATLAGDKSSLVITENDEQGLFNGFEVDGDAVTFSPEKNIVLGGKTFTVRAAGNEAESGSLAITADGEGYKMESADIYLNGRKVVTVSNINIAVGRMTGELTWKVTYIDEDNADAAMGDLTSDVTRSGYNKISGGEVISAFPSWGVNNITYILVDAKAVPGIVKKATLKVKVSGSSDNKRTTSWGVGYNNSVWSTDLTWNTADRTITIVGEMFNGTTKSSTTFQDAEFDITAAFADGEKTKSILLYETAAAGGYAKDITVEIEMAASALDAAKAQALEAVEKLPAGDGLFCYQASAIEEYKNAVNAAETVEAIEAIAMPAQNLPEAEAYYNIENKTAVGLYLNGTVISSTKGEAKLEATEGGYYIKFDEGYLNVKSGSTWEMEVAADPVTVWTFNVVDGYLTLKNPKGLLGTDDTADGSSVYADKSVSKNGLWTITKSDVTGVDTVKATEAAAPAVRKYIGKNGIVIEKNGVLYNVAGQMK